MMRIRHHCRWQSLTPEGLCVTPFNPEVAEQAK